MAGELDPEAAKAGQNIATVFMLRQLYTVTNNQLGTGQDGLLALRADLERMIAAPVANSEDHQVALAQMKTAALAFVASVFDAITEPDQSPGSEERGH